MQFLQNFNKNLPTFLQVYNPALKNFHYINYEFVNNKNMTFET